MADLKNGRGSSRPLSATQYALFVTYIPHATKSKKNKLVRSESYLVRYNIPDTKQVGETNPNPRGCAFKAGTTLHTFRHRTHYCVLQNNKGLPDRQTAARISCVPATTVTHACATSLNKKEKVMRRQSRFSELTTRACRKKVFFRGQSFFFAPPPNGSNFISLGILQERAKCLRVDKFANETDRLTLYPYAKTKLPTLFRTRTH